jgi:hypothetical protein
LAKPWLVESFAGHGTTWRDAIGGAVSKFKRGALHPTFSSASVGTSGPNANYLVTDVLRDRETRRGHKRRGLCPSGVGWRRNRASPAF